jgi:hypothetical protein
MTFGNGVVETTSYSGNRQQAIGVTAVKTGTTLMELGYSHCSTRFIGPTIKLQSSAA